MRITLPADRILITGSTSANAVAGNSAAYALAYMLKPDGA